MRAVLAALIACTATGSSVSAAGFVRPVGLTCKASNGAVVRLNLDLAAHRFQKEGFPDRPIPAVDARRLLLIREETASFTVTASIDRKTMDYVAESEDRATHVRRQTRYACNVGPPFEVASAE